MLRNLFLRALPSSYAAVSKRMPGLYKEGHYLLMVRKSTTGLCMDV